MIRIQQIKFKLEQKKDDLEKEILRILGIKKENLCSWNIYKESIDARKKADIKWIYTVDAVVKEEEKIIKKCKKNSAVSIVKKAAYQFPKEKELNVQSLKQRPVIIGTGPAGLFCGMLLAQHGYRPILLERGECVEKRCKTVENFWTENILLPHSNVQFGEGGAGTFSDGKLNTLVKDTFGRNKKVLEVFVEAGAPEEILYKNKPHIGTDILCQVVKHMREQIISYGGEIRFESQATDFLFHEEKHGIKKLIGVEINKKEILPCEVCVLAVGHSARDTMELLYQYQVEMQAKAFAVGFRVQHLQNMINLSQYGIENLKEKGLPAAEYKLTHQASNGRSVYSFCMCPGGYVVNASSEKGRIAVNGMSYHGRNGQNANSAIIMSITPADFKDNTPLAGIEFQRALESMAYQMGNGFVPIQLYEDFCENRIGQKKIGEIIPQIKGGYQFANLKALLPAELNAAFIEGMEAFSKKIAGFNRADTILAGVESRTSSPIRIQRNPETLQSNIKGFYPCGEGAGYAGGITSASMDGIKVAEAIAKQYQI